jgi:hypothetical protein
LTAYNRLNPNSFNIEGNSDRDSLLLWLENYCKKNPLEAFPVAVANLTDTLYEKRTRTAPKE